MKIIIVGGVAGGATCAARLRRLNESAEIIMLERGNYISFANCGLPYYIGGEIKDKAQLTLQTPQSFNSRFNIDVRVGNEAVSINRKDKTVAIKSGDIIYNESYDKLVLSMGAIPIIPKIEGVNSNRVFTLRSIPDTLKIKDYIQKNLPKSALIVGGGFIGIEMAENLKLAGLNVSLVEMSNQILAPFDFDMTCELKSHLIAKGVNIYLNSELEKIVDMDNGINAFIKGASCLSVDMIIMAIGVKAESDIAKSAGLDCNSRGGIIVNKKLLTSDENIYAIGDAIEVNDFVSGSKVMVPLAGPANKQGRIAAENICGLNSVYKGTQGSSIIKVFDMTAASTGLNEKTATALGLEFKKSYTLSANHAGYYPGAANMWVKTLCEKTSGKVLGAQIVGYEGVDKRCDVMATAIRANMTVYDLAQLELCYAPPYSSGKDPVNMAGFVLENIITKKVNVFHWHDIIKLANSGEDIFKLDVRTITEHKNGSIDGFINIPLDTLRSKLSQLDKTKTYYVHCQSGMRSYIACRILAQNGFKCYNLSGGYKFYNIVTKNQMTNI